MINLIHQISYVESSEILKCSLTSRTTTHPLKLEVYTAEWTQICRVGPTENTVTAVQRVVYAEESLDFELCSLSADDNVAADIYVSDPNTINTIMSVSIGNQSVVKNKLFLKEGTISLDNVLNYVLIELNELKLVISNNSMAANSRRRYKTIAMADFDVVQVLAQTVKNETETEEWGSFLTFDTMMGLIIFGITFIILVIIFCWRFSNT